MIAVITLFLLTNCLLLDYYLNYINMISMIRIHWKLSLLVGSIFTLQIFLI